MTRFHRHWRASDRQYHRLLVMSLMWGHFVFGSSTCWPEVHGKPMRFYCGTYTGTLGHVDGKARAIGIFELDGESGRMRLIANSPDIANSSHMCLGARGEHLYAISEIVRFDGRDDGCLTVFDVEASSGRLTKKQVQSSAGPGPAYVHLDRDGRLLLLANYVAGNIVLFPIGEDGKVGGPTANVAHQGSSIVQARQDRPHPHAVVTSPDNRFLFVPDLGIDRIVAYRLDAASGELTTEPRLDVCGIL